VKRTDPKITRRFEAIEAVLHDQTILAEIVSDSDKTWIMLSMLGSIKAPIGIDGTRHHRGARVKRTTVTAVSWISELGTSVMIVARLFVDASYPCDRYEQ
jgi:hypothetical protein